MNMKNKVSRLIWDDQGQSLIENALVVGLLALASTLAITFLSERFRGMFDSITVALGRL